MKRIRRVLLATAAVVLGACGGGDEKGSASASVEANASASVDTGTAGKIAASTACGGREALSFASTYASAMSLTEDQDFDQISDALQEAAKVAPSEIRADFTLVAKTLGPFFELFVGVESTTDYMKLVQDSNFQEVVKNMESDEFQQANDRVATWFEQNC